MEKKEKRDSIEIDLKRLLIVLWRRLWIIVLVGAVLGTAAFSYAWFGIVPTYSASIQLYVNNNYVGSPGFSSSQITAAQDLADTYMVILESRSVLEDVVEKTGLSYSYGQLKAMVTSASVNETEVFKVVVTSTNYKHAAQIANAIADILPEKISAVVEGSSVRVVDYAVENPNQVGPDYEKYALYGVAAGCLVTAAIFVIAELMNTSITSEDYLSQAYGEFPLLAVIPGTQSQKNGYYKGYYESKEKRRPAKKSGGVKNV